MKLTPLGIDFVRLRHGDDPATVARLTRWLLATWYARGWLVVIEGPTDPYTYRAATLPELLGLLDDADLLTVTWVGADTWLRLTERGAAEFYAAMAAS